METWEQMDVPVQPYEDVDAIVKREGLDGWEVDAYEAGMGWVGSSSGGYSIKLVRKIRFKRRKPAP